MKFQQLKIDIRSENGISQKMYDQICKAVTENAGEVIDDPYMENMSHLYQNYIPEHYSWIKPTIKKERKIMEANTSQDVQDSTKEIPNNSKEIPNNFGHHILLYAKGWYARSGDVLADLRTLLTEYSGTDPEYISDSNIRELLCECYLKYAKHSGRELMDMLGWGWIVIKRTPESIMLSGLSIADGKYVDPTKKLNVLIK